MNKYMNCATTIEGSGNAEALFAYYGTQPAANETMACDCPCDAFVDVEEPSYSTMVISHLAQVFHHAPSTTALHMFPMFFICVVACVVLSLYLSYAREIPTTIPP